MFSILASCGNDGGEGNNGDENPLRAPGLNNSTNPNPADTTRGIDPMAATSFNITFRLFVDDLAFNNQTYETNESLTLTHQFLFVNGSAAKDIFDYRVEGNNTYVSVIDKAFVFNRSSFSLRDTEVRLAVFFAENKTFLEDRVEVNPFVERTFSLSVGDLEFSQTYETNESLTLTHQFLFVNGSEAKGIFTCPNCGIDESETDILTIDEDFRFDSFMFSRNSTKVVLTVYFIERTKYTHTINVFEGERLVGSDSIVSFSSERPKVNVKMESNGVLEDNINHTTSEENITFYNAFGRVFESVDIRSDEKVFDVNIINSLSFSICSRFFEFNETEEKCVDFTDVFPEDVQEEIFIIDDGEDILNDNIVNVSFLSEGRRDISLLSENYTIVDWDVTSDDDKVNFEFVLYDVRRNTWGEYFAGQTRWIEKIVKPVRERNALPPFLMVDEGEINVSDETSVFNNLHNASQNLDRLGPVLDHGNLMLFVYCYVLDIDNCYRDSNLVYYNRLDGIPSRYVSESFDSNYTLSLSISNSLCNGIDQIKWCNAVDETFSNVIISMDPRRNIPCSSIQERCVDVINRTHNKIILVGIARAKERRRIFQEESKRTPPLETEIATSQTCSGIVKNCIRAIDYLGFKYRDGFHYRYVNRHGTSNSNKVITAVVNSLRGYLFGTNTAHKLYSCSQAVMMSFAEDRGEPGPDSLWGAGQLAVDRMFDDYGNPIPRVEMLQNAVDEGYLNNSYFDECSTYLANF